MSWRECRAEVVSFMESQPEQQDWHSLKGETWMPPKYVEEEPCVAPFGEMHLYCKILLVTRK